MGMLIEGRWTEEDRHIEQGAYVRPESVYDQVLPADVVEALHAEPGRFHLIASLSCPWSNRTMIVRQLKGLGHAVSLQIAGGTRVQGYAINDGTLWSVPGMDEQIAHVHQLYTLGEPAYTGRVTVPVLWDSRTRRIVSNASAKIIRAFDAVRLPDGAFDFTLVPESLRDQIDRLNALVHQSLSDAVYRAGFARRQSAYDEAVAQVFAMLDELERRLSEHRYLFGSTITETDWRLFPTLVRFDAVYHVLFRCSRRRLVDYPNLWAYARDLYSWRGVAETIDINAIREGAYRNDGDNNPFGIVAIAPDADWRSTHGRGELGAAQVALRTGVVTEIEPTTMTAAGGG